MSPTRTTDRNHPRAEAVTPPQKIGAAPHRTERNISPRHKPKAEDRT